MSPAPDLLGIHHAAIICSDYRVSRQFYTAVLGLRVLAENYRTERDSWKLDLQLPDGAQVELFSMPQAPRRASYPEACGLRHLAFAVANVQSWADYLKEQGVAVQPIRLDEYTGCSFLFFQDPDQLPIELYETPL
jgi:glyoxylase I family protein